MQIVGDEQHGALVALPHREKQRLQQQAGLAVERAVRRTPTPRPSGRADQRTGRARDVMFTLLPKADIEQASPDVCYGPISAARARSKNSLPFRYHTTAKSVTDLPVGA
jgi:hypothetical protein